MDHMRVYSPADLLDGLAPTDSVATEAFNPLVQNRSEVTATSVSLVTPEGTTPQLPPVLDIVQQGSTYYASLNLDVCDEAWLRTFLIWLYQRTADETIYLTLINDCTAADIVGCLCYFISLLQAIQSTKATVVGMIDTPIGVIATYIYMACQKLYIGSYAMLLVQAPWAPSTAESEMDRVMRPIITRLYEHAVQLSLLTEDEVASLNEGKSITLFVEHYEGASYDHIGTTDTSFSGAV